MTKWNNNLNITCMQRVCASESGQKTAIQPQEEKNNELKMKSREKTATTSRSSRNNLHNLCIESVIYWIFTLLYLASISHKSEWLAFIPNIFRCKTTRCERRHKFCDSKTRQMVNDIIHTAKCHAPQPSCSLCIYTVRERQLCTKYQ